MTDEVSKKIDSEINIEDLDDLKTELKSFSEEVKKTSDQTNQEKFEKSYQNVLGKLETLEQASEVKEAEINELQISIDEMELIIAELGSKIDKPKLENLKKRLLEIKNKTKLDLESLKK